MGTTHVLEDTALQVLLTVLRNKDTSTPRFRHALRRCGYLMTHAILSREITADETMVETVLAPAKGVHIPGKIMPVIVMRAGQPFASGAIELLDELGAECSIGVIDAKRLEGEGSTEFEIEMPTFKMQPYTNQDTLIVYDPMLATASTLIKILNAILERAQPKKLIVCSLLASQYGIDKLAHAFPAVPIYTLAIDTDATNGLNEKGYIVPGLGDAGDRAFGD